MKDKRFLKVKKVNEERYFRNEWELSKFIQVQNDMTFEDMYHVYNTLLSQSKNEKSSKLYFESQINMDNDRMIIGNFIFHIFRGNFDRTSGFYTINILSVCKTDNLTWNDRINLFKEEIEQSKAE